MEPRPVVLLGDACQAVSLFAGHGASMAMAGAWVLADELPGRDLPAALARYQERLREPIARTQELGRRTVKWMAPATRGRIRARDWILRAAGLPGVNRLVLRALTPGSHLVVRHGAGDPVAAGR